MQSYQTLYERFIALSLNEFTIDIIYLYSHHLSSFASINTEEKGHNYKFITRVRTVDLSRSVQAYK